MPCLYLVIRIVYILRLNHTYNESYSRKKEKLPNTITHACIYNARIFAFVYVLIHNVETVCSVTVIDTFSCFGGREVQEIPDLISVSDKDLYVWCLVCCRYVFTCWCKTIICHKMLSLHLQCFFNLYNKHAAKCVTNYRSIKMQILPHNQKAKSVWFVYNLTLQIEF